MAKNFTYWVIISGAHATAFRARAAEDLLPTLRQLQRTEPEAALRWFERGRLWASPEAARAASIKRPHPQGRDRRWRPGGSHVDPRAKYDISRDEKRARFKKRAVLKRTSPRPQGPRTKPPGRTK